MLAIESTTNFLIRDNKVYFNFYTSRWQQATVFISESFESLTQPICLKCWFIQELIKWLAASEMSYFLQYIVGKKSSMSELVFIKKYLDDLQLSIWFQSVHPITKAKGEDLWMARQHDEYVWITFILHTFILNRTYNFNGRKVITYSKDTPTQYSMWF